MWANNKHRLAAILWCAQAAPAPHSRAVIIPRLGAQQAMPHDTAAGGAAAACTPWRAVCLLQQGLGCARCSLLAVAGVLGGRGGSAFAHAHSNAVIEDHQLALRSAPHARSEDGPPHLGGCTGRTESMQRGPECSPAALAAAQLHLRPCGQPHASRMPAALAAAWGWDAHLKEAARGEGLEVALDAACA